MRLIGKIKTLFRILLFATFGAIATAAFLLCVISGILLAIPYDVNTAYDSISLMLISSPASVFVRNIHYWTAQIFLIFTFLHIYDHFRDESMQLVKKGVWLRLSIAALIVLYVMISGFVLKDDADSKQAFRIITSLLWRIPFVGNDLSLLFFGKEGNLQLLYIHHVATATVFLVIIIFEHARTIWTSLKTFLIVFLFVTGLSLFFNAPLHDNLSLIVKGPWYFVGVQEILHWLELPEVLLMITLFLMVLLYIIRFVRPPRINSIKRSFLYLFYIYLILTVIGYYFRGEYWQWKWPWNQKQDMYVHSVFSPTSVIKTISYTDTLSVEIPLIMGQRESCMVCHNSVKGFSESHDPVAIGCYSCHRGNRLSLNKNEAHEKMILIPGNLNTVAISCGTVECHPDIVQRVNNTLMTTLSGLVTIDRYVFGESNTLNQHARISEIGQTPPDNHLRDLCSACHLGGTKDDAGPVSELSRGGGCNACHIKYSDGSLLSLHEYKRDKLKDISAYTEHPKLSVESSNMHCFGCHSRSGRISANYEGWHETLLDSADISDWSHFRMFEDKRIFEKQTADVHFEAGMECIDCHNSYELMGDGMLHYHKEEQVKILCEDCHLEKPPKTKTFDDFDPETKKIWNIRYGGSSNNEFLTIAKSGIAMYNVSYDEGQVLFKPKNSDTILVVKPIAEECKRGKAHKRVTCSACHSSWAPQCIGCHNTYEPDAQGYDQLEKRYIKGAWIEHVGRYFAEKPTLGLVGLNDTTDDYEIGVFAPGMVLSIDVSDYPKNNGSGFEFHRLFAPVSPHATVREGRSCVSCHNDPLALGFGRGALNFEMVGNTGTWKFKPRFAQNKNDGIPEDAWIGFFTSEKNGAATRIHATSFNNKQLKHILEVGSCLVCHDEKSEVMVESLYDYDEVREQMSDKCVKVVWP